MNLISIKERLEDNQEFLQSTQLQESLNMTIGFFEKVGYEIPWIGYFVQQNEHMVGCAAFKGPPRNGRMEIAYGTFEPYRQKGVGTEICRLLLELAFKTDSTLIITARTLPEKNFSTKILEKNGFYFLDKVNDPEDGDLWEWIYQKNKMDNFK
jgi:RimJ/RimL family protein N-acetyltransferase